MRIKNIAISAILLLASNVNAQQKVNPVETTIFSSPDFSIYNNRVVQGEYEAVAVSPTEMTSNYKSPKNKKYSPMISFRFSINGKDNELPRHMSHELLATPIDGVYEMPIIKFGELTDADENPEGLELPPNTKVIFRVDMRDVLQSFAEKGYYEDIRGEKIAKEDFKGVYLAGENHPLSWDFENFFRAETPMVDVNNDSIYVVEKVLNVYKAENYTSHKWKLSKEKEVSQYPQQKSSSPLLDALYNLSLEEVVLNKEGDGTFRTGKEWEGVWTRDISYSVILGLGAIEPQRCMTSLRKKVKRRRIIQDTGSGGSWPVSSDRTVWALAAWELYCVTGDKAWLSEAYEIISNTLNNDLKVIFSPDGLAMGESSFIDWRKQSYPLWMNNVDIFRSENLGTNAVHYAAYRIASIMASLLGNDEAAAKYEGVAVNLQKSVNDKLWIPSKNYYGQYRYGRTYMTLSENPEMLGESLAILYGLAPKDKQSAIIANTPILNWGTPCFYPQIPDIRPYHNNGIWPFVQGFWNMASAKVGNGLALEQGLSDLYRAEAMFLTNKENIVAENGDFKTEVNSDRQLWSVAASLGMTYKVLFGMSFQDQGIIFSPVIPKSYAGDRSLTNFKYRDAVLNIKVSGYGNVIKSFKVNGKKQLIFTLPGNVKGVQNIEIVMADNDISAGQKINLVENKFAPHTPNVVYKDGTLMWDAINGAKTYNIYINGSAFSGTTSTSFKPAPSDKPVSYSVSAVSADGLSSFISEPLMIVPSSAIQIVEVEEFADVVERKLIDVSGNGAIEVSTQKNTELKMKVEIEEAGLYALSFRYSNGSGAVNTDNKCAIRTLKIDGKSQGAVVMAQRGLEEWNNWGYSNEIMVHLKKGTNHIDLVLGHENTNMNGDVNMALIDYMKIVKMD